MKKILFLSIIMVISGFIKPNKTKWSDLQNDTHITAHGDVNFDLYGSPYAYFSQKVVKNMLIINLIGTMFPNDPSRDEKTFIITLINIKKAGSYGFMLKNGDISLAKVSYINGSNDSDYYLSLQTVGLEKEKMPGGVIINSISDTSIDGTYTSKITNKEGKVLNVYGTFSGNIKKM
jgi:hypothetical protein